jgi:L-fuconolactonase
LGSDWPVCELAASYGEVLAIARSLFCALSVAEQAAIFGGNARRIYALDRAASAATAAPAPPAPDA